MDNEPDAELRATATLALKLWIDELHERQRERESARQAEIALADSVAEELERESERADRDARWLTIGCYILALGAIGVVGALVVRAVTS